MRRGERLKKRVCWQGLWCHCIAVQLKALPLFLPVCVCVLLHFLQPCTCWKYTFVCIHGSRKCVFLSVCGRARVHAPLILIGWKLSARQMPFIVHLQLAIHQPSSLSHVSPFRRHLWRMISHELWQAYLFICHVSEKGLLASFQRLSAAEERKGKRKTLLTQKWLETGRNRRHPAPCWLLRLYSLWVRILLGSTRCSDHP